MSNAWDHLPNAKHIDRVLAHITAHPEKWNGAEYNPKWELAWDVAVPTVERMEEWMEIWKAVWKAEKIPPGFTTRIRLVDLVRDEMRGALLALVIYDDCASMLDFTPEQIHLYVCLGVRAAILLEPAVKAMYE